MGTKMQVAFPFLTFFFFLVVYHGVRHASDRMGGDVLLLGRLGDMREV